MHSGHRERVRQKFKKYGTDYFEPHEILELALFYVVRRKDTNAIAHDLIRKFGSISAVFDASEKHLKEIEGISESVATFIKLIPHLSRIYSEDKFMKSKKPLTRQECLDKLSLKFLGRLEEVVAIMLFDAKNKIVFEGIINKGSVNSVGIYVRKILELITNYNAVSIILAHNHPSGIALPSSDDIKATNMVNSLLSGMQVRLIDHIIVADDDYVSMYDCKISDAFENNF